MNAVDPIALPDIVSAVKVLRSKNAIKVDRAIVFGEVAILAGWYTSDVKVEFPGLRHVENYRRIDVEENFGPTGKGFFAACELAPSARHITIRIDCLGDRYESQVELLASKKDHHIVLEEQKSRIGKFVAEHGEEYPDFLEQIPDELKEGLTPADLKTHRIAVDEVIKVGKAGYFFFGWSFGTGKGRRSLMVRTTDGRKQDLLKNAHRFPRQDLEKALGGQAEDSWEEAGFAAFLPTTDEDAPTTAQVCFRGRVVLETGLPEVTVPLSSLSTTQELLKHLHPSSPEMVNFLDRHLGPAISTLSFGNSASVVPEIRAYGQAPETPVVTVIVPLYGRYDFLEHQISQFANDPAFKTDIELLYVLDDPKLREEFICFCEAVAPLYGVPFRTVTYSRNLGYAGANNVGARIASAERLILLNSDVMPVGPGWVEALVEIHRSLPDCGALGTRLLFPDASLQHDGMVFERFPFLGNLWINVHPGKGLPPGKVGKNEHVVAVQAATAACLMVAKSDFLDLGGFDEGYLLGDFEDSDLCLSFIKNGKRNYVARDVILYHLERQSQSLFKDLNWKQKITVYNCWRHTTKWSSVLENVAAGEF